MFKRVNSFLIFVMVIFLSLGVVMASEDVSNVTVDSVGDDILSTSFSDESDVVVPVSDLVEYNVNSSNYGDYFSEEGNLIEGNVQDGDTIILNGVFNNNKFIFNTPLNIVGADDVIINGGSIVLLEGASGSNVSNLVIKNINTEDVQGIFLSGADNCNIFSNDIYCQGVSSFPIALNPGSDYNNIYGNTIKSTATITASGSKTSSAFVVGGSYYNYIANNYVEVGDANGIYLSQYGSGSFIGGISNYNTIFNNTVKCAIIPTSWNYGIQMMGNNNKAISNTVIGCYRGISASGDNITVTDNNLINLTGINFANGELEGGDYAIIVGSGSNVTGNVIQNSLVGAGIQVGSNSIVENNSVEVTTANGYGIEADGDNIRVVENNISTIGGADVYQMGQLTGLYVGNNRLVSNSGYGIFVTKQSSMKYPSNVTIVGNYINTTNEYGINIENVDKNSYSVRNNNVGESKILTPSGEVIPDPDFNFNGTIYTITPDNYNEFFDDNGNLINIYVNDNDILNFEGTFYNIKPIISESLKITGSNPIFYNTTFFVNSDVVWIENTTIINSGLINGWGIYSNEVTSLKITNNKINVTDESAAYTIYLYYTTNAQVENNVLISSGDYLTYTILTYGVEDSVISGNSIITNGTGEIHAYESSKCIDGEHDIQEIYRTYGILLLYTSGTNIVDNQVIVTSKVSESEAKLVDGSLSTNSLVGIDAYFGCDNNQFENNYVLVYGNDNYIYGMGILAAETGTGSTSAEGNALINNTILVRGNYFGTGIIIGYNSKNTSITGNEIEVVADSLGYGITLEASSDSIIINNNVNISSQVIYGLEMFVSDNNEIRDNIIEGNGNYVYGIAGYSSNNNKIVSNDITANGDDSIQINFTNYDALGTGNGGILFRTSSSNNLISGNSIISKINNAVILNNSCNNNNVTDNCLFGETNYSDKTVTDLGLNNYINGNYAYLFDNLVFVDVSGYYMGDIILSANSGITNDDDTTVYFYIDDQLIGSTKTVSGVATYKYKLNSSFGVGSYNIHALFEREDYKSDELNAILDIDKSNIKISVDNITGSKGSNVLITAVVADNFGNLVEGIEVEFYRGSNYIGKAITNVEGVASLNYLIPSTLSGDVFELKAIALESDNYNGNQSYATLSCSVIQIVAEDLVIYYKNGTPFVVYLINNGRPVIGEEIIIEINNVNYTRVTNDEGFVSMAVNLNPGFYDINVYYDGLTVKSTVTVLSTLEGSDIVKYYRNGTQYYVTLFDGQGNPLANRDVSMNINGVFYTRTTDSGGVARLNINLNPDVYIITVTDPNNGLLMSNNITVLSKLVHANDITLYYQNGTAYSVTLLDDNGNAVSGTGVTFNINGVFYIRTTDSEGVARLNINLNPGEYVITAEYDGLMVSNIINVLPILTGNNYIKQYGESGAYECMLVDGQGNPLANEEITMNINGVFYSRVTDSEGVARLNINLNPGEYIVTSYWENAALSNKVTVLN